MTANKIKQVLRKLADPQRAKDLQWFFKTGKGEYGEGDVFHGIRVPVIRAEAKKFKDMSLKEVQILLKSKYHEERLAALLVLVQKFARGDEKERMSVYKLYLDNTKYINNWDLVDLSAHKIVGVYLEKRSRKVLYKLALSKSLWERRISVIAFFNMIRSDDFGDCLKICEMHLDDKEDLIHKAVGWMLREIGKRDMRVEEGFLKKHYKKMPRTMLRYAIERFPERKRQNYLKGRI